MDENAEAMITGYFCFAIISIDKIDKSKEQGTYLLFEFVNLVNSRR
jgi:hypothetical protein